MAYNKPIPVPQGESDVYWEKAKQRELWLRKCNDCGNSYFYPRDISPCCFSKDTEWGQASGKATLFTYGIVQRAPHPGFVDDKSGGVPGMNFSFFSLRNVGIEFNNPCVYGCLGLL